MLKDGLPSLLSGNVLPLVLPMEDDD
jgi:hypothetical protein